MSPDADPPARIADATAADEDLADGDLADRLASPAGLFLVTDFDGTLAPITDRPEDATILPDARDALAALADRPAVEVAVVSGRALEDVRDRVGLAGVGYAGNNGLKIRTEGEEFYHPAAADAAAAVRRAVAALRERLAEVDGVVFEDKGPTAAVHYRLVEDPEDVARVRRAVERVAADADGALRTSEGKRHLELRPAVDWDKGRAVEWLLDVATPADWTGRPVYLGDDAVDEPAFEAVAAEGVGVRVGPADEATAAGYVVDSPGDVAAFLEWLVEARADRA